MSAMKSVFRELRQAVLDGMAHSKDKLHQLADNLTDHLDNLIRQVRGIDTFDGAGTSGMPGHAPGDTTLVPRPECLDADGNIDWTQAPHNGFELDANGKPISADHVPSVGDRFDRYGDPDGRFVSPVPDGGPFSYGSRSLPYAENANAYHQYEWTRSPADLETAYGQADDLTRAGVDEILEQFELNLGDMTSVTRGEVAAIPAWGTPGGATQDLLPLSVGLLDDLGMIKKVG